MVELSLFFSILVTEKLGYCSHLFVRYFRCIRTWKYPVAEAQCCVFLYIYKVFSLLFLNETYFFSVATMLNIVKLFRMKWKMEKECFQKGVS